MIKKNIRETLIETNMKRVFLRKSNDQENIESDSNKEKDIDRLRFESETTFRRLVEELRVGVYRADVKGNLFYVNSSFVNILGYQNKDEVVGLNLSHQLYVDPKDRGIFLQSMEKTGFVRDYIVKNKRKDGSTVILSVTSNYIRNEREEVIGVEGVVEDVTERVKLEEMIKIEKSKLEEIIGFDEKISRIRKLDLLFDFVVRKVTKILEAKKCSIMMIDDTSKGLYIKGSVGLDDENIRKSRVKMGEAISGIVAQGEQPLLVRDIETDRKIHRGKRASYQSRSFISVPIKLEGKVTGVINVADKCGYSDQGKIFNEIDLKILCAISREVAVAIENVKLYKELNYLTVIDPLTQIYNLRQFKKSLHHEISRAKRFPEPLCLMMIDVDDLKSYNDTFGHLEGNKLLKGVSIILKENLREIDIACRFGGDEFAVILPETDVKGAGVVANKIINEVGKFPFKREITLSIGLAERGDKMGGDDFICKADQALYEAKKKGKNQLCVSG